jgi:hypothetical protein
MSNTDIAWDPLVNPLLFARLAADMAGFRSPGTIDENAPGSPSTDFVLDFEIQPGLKLLLAHESQGPCFVVASVAFDVANQTEAWTVALRMNHHLPPSMRFSVDEAQNDVLHLTQILDAAELPLETLALAVTDASEVMQMTLASSLYSQKSASAADTVASLPPHLIRA